MLQDATKNASGAGGVEALITENRKSLAQSIQRYGQRYAISPHLTNTTLHFNV